VDRVDVVTGKRVRRLGFGRRRRRGSTSSSTTSSRDFGSGATTGLRTVTTSGSSRSRRRAAGASPTAKATSSSAANISTTRAAHRKSSRANVGRWAAVTNPAFTATNGQQPLIYAPDVGFANASPGGLILSGVNAGMAFNSQRDLEPVQPRPGLGDDIHRRARPVPGRLQLLRGALHALQRHGAFDLRVQ